MQNRQQLRDQAQQYYDEAKRLGVDEEKHEEARRIYLEAIKTLSQIPVTQLEDNDLRELGKYHYNVADCACEMYGQNKMTEAELKPYAINYFNKALLIWDDIKNKTETDNNRLRYARDHIKDQETGYQASLEDAFSLQMESLSRKQKGYEQHANPLDKNEEEQTKSPSLRR